MVNSCIGKYTGHSLVGIAWGKEFKITKTEFLKRIVIYIIVSITITIVAEFL